MVVMPEPGAASAPLPAVGQTAALAAVSPTALRIVLFGLPAAGKSSLLGALAQAAQTQEHLLNGRLVPRSDGLPELQKRLYVENPRPTAEEVAPYPVEFEPFAHDGQAAAGRAKVEAVLIDCDGRVANDLLARRRTLPDDTPEGTLAREVVEADTLILVVDAAAPPVQVDAEFAEFGRFLRLLEVGRGERTEVGGLPVFLVLTKCDLLAQPNDANVDWLERIEERKRQVHRRFQDFLSRRGRDEGPLPFGRIDLHLWATAVKRPALGAAPPKPREPYGVAELFRQCLEAAQAFRQRQRHSSRRLLWTVTGALGVLAGMAALVLGLVVGRPHDTHNPLESKVINYRSREKETTSARLRGDLPTLQAKVSELTDFKNDPNFAGLPQDEQDFVNERLAELEAYRSYREQLQQIRPASDAQIEADLKEIEKALDKLQPPPEYQKAWGQTEAVLAREQRLKDVAALRRAVAEAEDWYRGLRREGERLLRFAVDRPAESGTAGGTWDAWYEQLRQLEDRAASPRFRKENRLPGSEDVTYATVLGFNRVAEARADWETVKQRLDQVRDLAALLGLISPPAGPPPLLVIPRPPDFPVEARDKRLESLARAYPRYDGLSTADLPDPVAEPLRRAARANYGRLLDTGRAEVLKHLQAVSPDGRETLEHWRALRPWLDDPRDLRSWRALARVLDRLQDAQPRPAEGNPPDAVDELSAFLARDHFDLDLKQMQLEVPFGLNAKPEGKLSLFHPPTADPGPALVFRVEDPETDMERRVRIYPLRLEGPARKITYHPGEGLWATLPVEYGSGGGWVLDWVRGRSRVFQLDHLWDVPQLHQQGEKSTSGEPARGVALVPSKGSTLPRLPELIPVVELEKQ
jgi:hypothetical protein